MAEKTLNELLHEKVTTLPKYLIVRNEQMGYHGINEGQEVYATDAKGIQKMELNADNTAYEAVGYVVQADATNSRVYFVQNTNKNPYTGKGAVEVELQEGDNINRAMLELFGEFAKGRFNFGVTVYATDVVGVTEDVTEPPTEPPVEGA